MNLFLAVLLDPRLKDTKFTSWGFSSSTRDEILDRFREVRIILMNIINYTN